MQSPSVILVSVGGQLLRLDFSTSEQEMSSIFHLSLLSNPNVHITWEVTLGGGWVCSQHYNYMCSFVAAIFLINYRHILSSSSVDGDWASWCSYKMKLQWCLWINWIIHRSRKILAISYRNKKILLFGDRLFCLLFPKYTLGLFLLYHTEVLLFDGPSLLVCFPLLIITITTDS